MNQDEIRGYIEAQKGLFVSVLRNARKSLNYWILGEENYA